LITKGKPHNSVLSSLRKEAKRHLSDYLKKKDYNECINAVINIGLQRELKNTLKKIYPIGFCEFGKVLKI